MRDVVLWDIVIGTLFQHLGEKAYSHLRDRLVGNLRSDDRFKLIRRKRHPDDERLFVYTLYSFEENRRHELEFHVDDVTSDGHLFVVRVIHHDDIIE